MDGHEEDRRIYLFDTCRLDPISRSLTHAGALVPLPPRLFDTLHHLVRHAGRLVPRAELLAVVWPNRVVEEGNIDRAISSLRAALKASGAPGTLIVTVTGRGYRLGATVMMEAPPAPQMSPVPQDAARRVFPRWRHAVWLGGALVLCGAALWAGRPAGGDAAPPRSVAVLPFSNLSGEPAQEVFSDGISAELINALGRVAGLHVAAGSSSFLFKAKPVSIADIAHRLRVGAVLEGCVRREGGRVLITAQLVDAATGYQLWARRYDRSEADLPAVEADIAETVMGSLGIATAAAANLTPGGTQDAAAFDFYLAGMAILARTGEEASQAAEDAFSAAIARDPHYALALAERAQVRAYQSATAAASDLSARRAAMAQALVDAERSVSLAPDLGAAHASLALVLKYSLTDFSRVQAEYSRAVDLSPGDAAILMSDAFFELDLGHAPVAVAEAERAASLDPLTPATYKMLAEILAEAGRFGDAFTALRRAQAVRPDPGGFDPLYLGIVQTLAGYAQAAARTCAGARDYHDLSCLAWAYHKLGRFAEADAALAKLHALAHDDGAYLYARIAAQWGRQDEALAWLHKAYAYQDSGLIAIRIDPFLAPLRQTAEYQRIEQKLGFPEK
jgi:TolB-like protein/DNA-binding winged helix-turn-helix (wHTH) protein